MLYKNFVWASQAALVVKNLPANAEDARVMSSIPGSGRSPAVGNGNPLQEPGGLQSMGLQRVKYY